MNLPEYYKYIRSLFKDEVPALGYLYRVDKYGSVGELIPLYALLYNDWKFFPLTKRCGHVKEKLSGVRELVSANAVTDYVENNSIDRIEDMYKVFACNHEDDISLEAAGALYNVTHPGKWEDLEPYQRSNYISELADHIVKNHEVDKSIAAESLDDSVEIINAKLNSRSNKVLCELIKEAIPGIVFHLSGAPIFIENNHISWTYEVKNAS